MKVFALEIFYSKRVHVHAYRHTHTHTFDLVQSKSISIYLSISLSTVFLDMMFVNILLIITADFDEKNTDEKRACRPNLRILCISNTPSYTIVTMLSVKTAKRAASHRSSFLHHPFGFIYISNSATPNVEQANEPVK